MIRTDIDDELLRYFQIFWGDFPAPVMLVYRDRTIFARNKAAEALVGCTPGERCADLHGCRAAHNGCRANSALSERSAQRSVEYNPEFAMVIDSYWIPLEGYRDIYVHFGIDITEHAAERYFPEKR